jgi:thiol-disulfide isomerase/thioredoxin
LIAGFVRCGADSSIREEVINPTEEALDTRVHAAMKKLGLLDEGVGKMRDENDEGSILDQPKEVEEDIEGTNSSVEEDAAVADQILRDFNTTYDKSVTKNMVLAALAASGGNASLAREIIQYEVQLVGTGPTSKENQEGLEILLAEGKYEKSRIQRALALTDNDIPNARAILDAELEDEAIEAENYVDDNTAMPTVNIPANFDPTTLHPFMPASSSSSSSTTEKTLRDFTSANAATDDDMLLVVNATSDNIQRLVLESPLPVLLDVYANWCGPCKALAPVLEELAIKTKLFRLAKLNSDEEQAISNLLGVTALPTVFGLRKGQIINSFRGMPKSQEELQSFIFSLYDNNKEPSSSYKDISLKLAKVAGSTAYPFHIRERMTYRITHYLNELLQIEKTTAIDTAELLHKVIINIINHPFAAKYRKINLYNRIFAEKVTPFPSAIKILEIIGFHSYIDDPVQSVSDGNDEKMYLLFGQSQQEVINTVPLAIGRDSISKWLEKHRGSGIAPYTSLKRIQETTNEISSLTTLSQHEEPDLRQRQVSTGSTATTTSTTTLVKYRFEGKNKVHEAHVNVHTSLKDFIHRYCLDDAALSYKLDDVQITCISKRLIIKLSDHNGSMDKSFHDHGLYPSAQLVVKLVSVEDTKKSSNNNHNLKERATKRKKKRGSHTMQSVGIYAKDDNNKAELIDGGGGVWYEHDVSDDELEGHTDDCNRNVTSPDENDDFAGSDVNEE